MKLSILIRIGLILCTGLTLSCQSSQNKKEDISAENKNITYPRMIGDIAPNSSVDETDFQTCNGDDRIVQYYALGEKTYIGEKWAIEQTFKEQYIAPKMDGESGLIRVRFVINCKGKSGRFRLISMDSKYQEKKFDSKITTQLLNITKSLDGWKVFRNQQQKTLEYYQYLIFKIKDGQLNEIMP